ncbi:Unconventional myosin-Id isoform X5 [Oopsacas minuta]|uniref:Unconventional myosin-Id isoform X5 n=1 Tax=Oopsacas minuta TaxID=111878 RepID=A0AAV7JGN2_9METZ|nr:Unconventional myosin-Id isoform X5 [Oopsacas minuta]
MKAGRRKMPEGLPDFTQVDNLTLDTFILNLKMRYESEQIYSYIGESLIAVNPYEEMKIFGDDVIETYKGSELFQNAPHPFSIADAAYQLVTKTRDDHCIVATGESGSGKECSNAVSIDFLSLKFFDKFYNTGESICPMVQFGTKHSQTLK